MRLLFPCAATIAVILLAAQVASAGGAFPKVVVTVAPLKPYVDEIMKGHGEAKLLLRPGQDAHSFALTLPQAQMLDDADIIVVPDKSMSPFLERALAKKKQIKIVELSALEGAYPLPYMDKNPWMDAAKEAAAPKEKKTKKPSAPIAHTDETDGSHNKPANTYLGNSPSIDPHLWLDPERMAAIALPLANVIAEHAPEARQALQANAKTLAKHLRGQVIPNLRMLLGNQARELTAVDRKIIPFITYHAAYQYFLARFQLTHYGEITKRSDEAMGAKTIATTLNSSKNLNIRCIIGEQKNVLMVNIAKSTGARIVILSPEQIPNRADVDALGWIKSDYDRVLYVTAKAFGECL